MQDAKWLMVNILRLPWSSAVRTAYQRTLALGSQWTLSLAGLQLIPTALPYQPFPPYLLAISGYIQYMFNRKFWSPKLFKWLGFRAIRSTEYADKAYCSTSQENSGAQQKKQKQERYTCLRIINYHSLKQIWLQKLSVAKLISSFNVNWNAKNPFCLSKNVLLYVVHFFIEMN